MNWLSPARLIRTVALNALNAALLARLPFMLYSGWLATLSLWLFSLPASFTFVYIASTQISFIELGTIRPQAGYVHRYMYLPGEKSAVSIADSQIFLAGRLLESTS